jgi:glycosidase
MIKRIISTLLLFSFLSACAQATPTVVPTQTATPAPETVSANWWNEAVFYEIFVRSFNDSDGNGIGDFNGITQKLDYLQELGITAIWLMPINPSPSYHGYDVINYYNVNYQYGTMADFKNLLNEAHKRDIKIIIDLVLNHTSNQNPWFKEAEKAPTSPYRNWYIWSETDPGYQGPWRERVWHPSSTGGFYYGIFVGVMPDLNYNNPEVTKEMNNVVTFWLTDVGVDGFRLDAAKHLIEENTAQQDTPSTHAWLKEFYTAYKLQNPQAYTVGEVVSAGASAIKSYTGDQMDHVFNFEMSSGFVNSVKGGGNSGIVSAFKFAFQDMPDFNYATFLTNHDQNRVMSVFNGDVNKAKAAASLMLTSPGTPFIYYGEEIGMIGVKPDEDIRVPMQWSDADFAGFSTVTPWRTPNAAYTTVNVAAENEDTSSLLNHYRALIQLRKDHPALLAGDATLVDTGNTAIFALLRNNGDESILIVINLGKDIITDYKLSLKENKLPDGSLSPTVLFGADQVQPLEITNGTFSDYKPLDEIAAYQTIIIKLK